MSSDKYKRNSKTISRDHTEDFISQIALIIPTHTVQLRAVATSIIQKGKLKNIPKRLYLCIVRIFFRSYLLVNGQGL